MASNDDSTPVDAALAAFYAAPVAGYVFRHDDGGFVLEALNDAARAITALPASMIGMRLDPLYANQPAVMEAGRLAFEGRTSLVREIDVRRYDRVSAYQRLRLTFAYVPPDRLVIYSEDRMTPEQEQRALQELEARNASIIATMTEGVLVVDATRTILFANAAIARFVESTEGELLGRVVDAIGSWLDVDGALAEELPWSAVLRGDRGVVSARLTLRARSGARRALLVSAQPIRAVATGEITSVACTLTDVSELERSLAALRESEAKYRLILDATSEGVWAIDFEGRTRFANARMAEILGTTHAELLASRAIDWLTPEGREAHRLRLEARARGESHAFECEFVREDGRRVLTSAMGAPIVDGGAITGTVSMFRDITAERATAAELAQSREWLDAALVAGKMGVFEVDPETDRIVWTRHLDEALGAPPTLDFDGYRALIHPDDLEGVARAFRATPVVPGSAFDHEFRMVHPVTGAVRSVHTRGRYVDGGRGLRLVGAIADVSEKRQMEEALAQAQRLESLGRLAGGVAHDFNNLLTVMLASFSLVLPAAPEAIGAELQIARQAAERARDLTRQLLAFARRQLVEITTMDLEQHLLELAPMLRRLASEGYELSIDVDRALGAVRVDVAQFEQVIINLVLNAREAMSDGGRILLHASAREVSPEEGAAMGLPGGSYAALAVRDEGSGMDAHTRDHAFEPFFTTKRTGSGFGLASAYGIARKLGGTILIESAPGAGTTMTLLVPRAEGEAAPKRREPPPIELAEGEHVLFVEDDELVRRTGRRILERLGYRVEEAIDGLDALERVRASSARFDLVVTDMVMPRMNGMQLIRALSELAPGLPVLVVSGYADAALGELGEASFLAKPYTLESLASRLRALLPSREGGQRSTSS